jgi:class 3 adenylate cyclase/energy-coupling factor transporter ATP-binding protein EcfA2
MSINIADWLRGLGLEQYAPAFHDNDIDSDILPELTADDLVGLGVTSIGHRRKLLAAIAALRDGRSISDAPIGSTKPRRPGKGAGIGTGTAERRHLTVMFCDLVGSTALSARLDPEDLRDVIGAYHAAVAKEVRRLDGFVAKYMGDGVLAYFGYPQAHEDDAERAVRAGLALVDSIGRLNIASAKLEIRVGIATGLVVVGDLIGEGSAQEQAVVGETPNLAARLQAEAGPGEIIVAQDTSRLLGGLFEIEDLGPRLLKGIADPVRALRVCSARSSESRFESRARLTLAPMVGRDDELALLLGRWRHAAAAGEGEAVLLVGEPGIGKSRLVRALCDAIKDEPHTRVVYQCSPYYGDSPLWPVIQQLRAAASFSNADSIGDKLDKLGATLPDAEEPQEHHEDLLLLADLLGLDASERCGPILAAPQEQRARTLQCLIRVIRRSAARQPVLVCFEDLHWIDPTSLELIELALEQTRDARVFLVLTSRPEGQPSTGALVHLTRLELGRLGQGSAGRLVREITPAGTLLPESLIAEVVARTDGVPLFVEELTKAILEGPWLHEVTAGPDLGAWAAKEIPSSLAGSLMARLDRLSQAKEVAQIAACVGREFDERLLAAVVDRPDTLAPTLEQLCAAGLIFRRAASLDDAYVFKHALVRDAIYESCLRSQRKRLHARVAKALVERSTGSDIRSPETIAVHLLAAEEPAEALPHILAAARAFAGCYAYVEALRWFEKGAGLIRGLPGGDERRQRLELDLYVAWTPVLMAVKGFSDRQTLAVAEHADTLCQRFGALDRLLPVLFGQLSYYGAGGGSLNSALEIATRIQRHGERSGDATALLVGSRTQGFCFLWMGRLKEAEAVLQSALEQAPRAPAGLALQFGHDPETTALTLLGSVQQRLGFVDKGGEMMQAALTKAEQLGHPLTYAYVLRHASVFAAAVKNYSLVERLAGKLTEVCSKYEIRQWERLGPLMRAWVDLRTGTGASSTAALETLLEEHRTRGFRRNLPFYLMLVADVLLDRGGLATAPAMIEDGHRLMREMDETWVEPELLGLRARLHAGKSDAAIMVERERLLVLSQEAARQQGARIADLRAAISLTRLWRDQGKRTEARALLSPVYGWFTEGFDKADLKEAKALLDELA